MKRQLNRHKVSLLLKSPCLCQKLQCFHGVYYFLSKLKDAVFGIILFETLNSLMRRHMYERLKNINDYPTSERPGH